MKADAIDLIPQLKAPDIPGITVPLLEPWRQLLLNAADYMEQHGKCKFVLETRQGKVCTIGAISRVADPIQKSLHYPCKFSPNLKLRIAHVAVLHFASFLKGRPVPRYDAINIVSTYNDMPFFWWRSKWWIANKMRACARKGLNHG